MPICSITPPGIPVLASGAALLTAYKHTAHSMPHARVEIDRKSGEIAVWAQEFGPDGELGAEA